VNRLKPDHLTNPQPGTVGGQKKGIVFKVFTGGQDFFHLFTAQGHENLFFFWPGRYGQFGGTIQHMAAESFNPGELDVAGAPGQFPVCDNIVQIVLDLFVCKLIR